MRFRRTSVILGLVDSVLIVDDNGSFRAVAGALLEAGGFQVVGEADSIAAALTCATTIQPAVVLLDIGLPDRDGVSACADVQAAFPTAAIVFCSVRGIDQYGDAVARSPAIGFLTKSQLSAEALARIVAGQRDRR